MGTEHYALSSTEGSARVGVLKTNHGNLSLPCVMPVVKPTIYDRYWMTLLREYPPEALMINASILRNWPRVNNMTKQGIHSYLNYDGIIFSDGGGFSKESRGLSQEEILPFQLQLGVDVITTLDYPTHLSRTWVSRDRIKRSLKNALLASQFMNNRSDVLLLASIHAPSVAELRNSILFLNHYAHFDGFAVGSLLSVQSCYKTLVDLVLSARRAAPEKHLHVYGIAGASTYLLMFYLGADSVDSQGALLSGSRMHYYVPRESSVHIRGPDDYGLVPCKCPICTGKEKEHPIGREELAIHNFLTVQSEISLVRQLINEGSFNKYLERRFKRRPILSKALQYATRRINQFV